METHSIPALPPSRNANSEPDEHDRTNCPHRRRHGFLAGLVLGILGAGLIGFAIGATMPAAEAALGALAHGGFGPGGDGPPTPEEIKDHAEFFVGFALHRLDASPEQEDHVQKIVNGAIDDVFPVVERHRANREELRQILGGQTIDRAGIEKLRVEEVALADNLSRIVATAVGDTAEVLSAQQRSELLERLERFHHRH
jgi:Spy/CpxP family protein refolding chaperone